MSISNVNLSIQSSARLSDYKDRVLATATALFIVYAINYGFQFIGSFILKENKVTVQRKIFEISQVLYWFGVATIFSIFPPFYYGAFNAVIAYVTLIVVVLMHIFAFVDRKVSDRSLFGIAYFFYHLLITVWILVGLILAYIWSNQAYEAN